MVPQFPSEKIKRMSTTYTKAMMTLTQLINIAPQNQQITIFFFFFEKPFATDGPMAAVDVQLVMIKLSKKNSV